MVLRNWTQQRRNISGPGAKLFEPSTGSDRFSKTSFIQSKQFEYWLQIFIWIIVIFYILKAFCIICVFKNQCFRSGSSWIRIQLVARIRIRIRNADPDPGGLKRAKMKKKRSKKPDN
jgi:hypothetical protein